MYVFSCELGRFPTVGPMFLVSILRRIKMPAYNILYKHQFLSVYYGVNLPRWFPFLSVNFAFLRCFKMLYYLCTRV